MCAAAWSRCRFFPGMLLRVALTLALLPLGLLACQDRTPEEDRSRAEPAAPPPASVTQPPPPSPEAPRPPLRYRRVAIPGPARLRAVRDSLGASGFTTVLKVNRIDLQHVYAGDSLIIPEGLRDRTEGDSLRYSPFPLSLPVADSLPKLLLVSLRVQAFGAYERGTLVRWGPTSTGKKATPTPARLYHTNWKDQERTSTVNGEWILLWYLNLDNIEGISIHQYALPGYPASHSCVRLPEEDARWLYAWAEQWRLASDGAAILEQGTPVLVFGEYPFGRRRPWKRLPEEPEATTIPASEIETVLRNHLAR
jgi:hypothetical protein